MEKFIPILIVAAFAVVFPIMWVTISRVLSRLGGWAALAERYADNTDEQGKTYYMRSGRVGVVNYGACLNLRVCERGLRLSVLFPFRVGHPPIFIPWDQFHGVAEKQLVVFRLLSMPVGNPMITRLLLPIWVRDHLPTDQNTA